MRTIVVTSTAKDAIGYAGRCTESVRRERERLRRRELVEVFHRFVAADHGTADDAIHGGAPSSHRTGAIVEVREAQAIENLRYIWDSLPSSAIVVWLDGDDELAEGALERVLGFYERSDVWLTYGSFITDQKMRDWLYHPHFGRRYLGKPRLEQWRASHLKTFRAGLVQAIPGSYLEAGGDPVTHAVDCAVMFAALELAGERYAVSTDVNCIYSVSHSAESKDKHGTRELEASTLAWLRALQPLDALERAPW